MISDELKQFAGSGPTERLEVLDQTDPSRVAESVCAMLNTKGGRVFVGVDRRGRTTGLKDVEEVAKSIRSHLENSITPTGMWAVSSQMIDRDGVVAIDVSAGPSKPYLIDGRIWARHGGRTAMATPSDLHRIIEERLRADRRWERQRADELTLDSLDVQEILAAAAEIEKKDRRTFTNSNDPQSVLEELSLWESGGPTNAAVVLFGKEPSKLYPQTTCRVTIYKSDKGGDVFLFDERIEMHLFATVKKIEVVLAGWVGVSSTFEPGQWKREDRREYPLPALREGVLNALVHRDFASPSGGASIDIYPERILIWNYGSLPEGLDGAKLTKEHPSLPRNPDIAQVCFLRGLIERIGRGTVVISRTCAEAGLQAPKWESGSTGTRLSLFGQVASRKAGIASLNERQVDLLKRTSAGKMLTLADYASGAPITDRTARNDLAALVRGGWLRKRGQGRSTFYVRTEQEFR